MLRHRPAGSTLFPYTTLFRSRVGTVIAGHYRIDRLLGAGGMGVVYQAEELRERRSVALKMLLPKHRNNPEVILDRKSTRLNSSHVSISYAVFCLKKKITQIVV